MKKKMSSWSAPITWWENIFSSAYDADDGVDAWYKRSFCQKKTKIARAKYGPKFIYFKISDNFQEAVSYLPYFLNETHSETGETFRYSCLFIKQFSCLKFLLIESTTECWFYVMIGPDDEVMIVIW